MKKVMLAIAIVSLMASCGESQSGKREVTQIVKVKLSNGDLDWIRLNSIEMRVFKEGDSVRMNRTVHRIGTDSSLEKAVITSIIK